MRCFKSGLGNLFSIAGRMNCRMSLAGRKFFYFQLLKFNPCLPKENKERKLCQGARETSLDLLSTCLLVMKLRLDVMFCSNFGNENSDAGHINFPCGPQVPHPRFKCSHCKSKNC